MREKGSEIEMNCSPLPSPRRQTIDLSMSEEEDAGDSRPIMYVHEALLPAISPPRRTAREGKGGGVQGCGPGPGRGRGYYLEDMA